MAIISIYFVYVNKNSKLESFQDTFNDIATRPTGESIQKLISIAPDTVRPEDYLKDGIIPNDPVIQSKVIRDIYYSLYNGFPSTDEISFYRDYINHKEITKSQLIEIVKASAKTLSKTLITNNYLDATVYGTEDDVVVIFNEILMRNPDEDELTRYSKTLATDKKFNREKLRQLLYNTEEYKRMEMTQINDYNSELLGRITDRQLTLTVQTYYKDITGIDDIDDDTLKFLKKKYIDFNGDESRFKNFIVSITANTSVIVSSTKTPESVISTTQVSTPTYTTFPNNKVTDPKKTVIRSSGVTTSNITPNNVITEEEGRQKVLYANNKDLTKKYTYPITQEQTYTNNVKKQTYTNGAKTVQEHIVNGSNTDQPIINNICIKNPNHDIIKKLLNLFTYDKDGQYKDSKNVINTIQNDKTLGETTKQSKKTNNNLVSNTQSLAELTKDRNNSELKEICLRNKKFADIDQNGLNDNLVLDPTQRWSVPQQHPSVCIGNFSNYEPSTEQTSLIGTLISNTNETKVGSILPLFPNKTTNN